MGQTGSYTAKIEVTPALTAFTKWDSSHIKELMKTCQHTLSDTFALRLQEFVFMIGKRTLTLPQARYVFSTLFDTDGNDLVDKFEMICGIILLSAMSSENKIGYIYDLFDFNDKGYLVETEMILLLRTITKTADKIDPNMGAPPDDRIREIAKDSMSFAFMHPNNLRKYELVEFAANYPTVRAFLESWRGHASQVLLASHQKWQDQTFPALQSSIAPSTAWLAIGLPPAEFVKWRRRERVSRGCKMLFGHADKFVKASDRIFLEGAGCMAQGTLKQGLLADRWILDAMAVIIASPRMIKYIFATTGQEDVGRFCVRLFESRGWQSVFVDDRLPCDPLNTPLFMGSSCDNECWPMVLEKGIAKRLGSYGHIASCGVRCDAAENALRWLTGGHVNKVRTSDFDWRSISAEVQTKDGVAFVLKLLKEESLVSFGKSDTMVFHFPKKKKKKDKNVTARNTLPYGRLFPVIGLEVRKGYRFFVLRDAWGLVPHAVLEPDHKYGQCRTFQIAVEDIPDSFDVMMTSRFPDSLKAHVFKESKRLIHSRPPTVPWITEILHQETDDIHLPGRFLLRVLPSPCCGILAKREKGAVVEVTDDPIEVCITISSSVAWGDSSDVINPRPPHIFGRLVPTIATREKLMRKGVGIVDVMDSTRVRRPPEETKDFSALLQTSAAQSSILSLQQSSAVSAGLSASAAETQSGEVGIKSTSPRSADNCDDDEGAQQKENSEKSPDNGSAEGKKSAAHTDPIYDFPFCCERNWCSHTFMLPPGEYILSAYSEEYLSTTPGVVNGMVVSKIPSNKAAHDREPTGETPRQIFKDDVGIRKGIWAHVTSIGAFGLSALSVADMEANVELLQETPLVEMQKGGLPLPEVWPFLADHQQEMGSKGLIDVITRVRREVDELNLQILELKFGNAVSYDMDDD